MNARDDAPAPLPDPIPEPHTGLMGRFRNYFLTGLIVAEAVMMGLAPVLGRQHAHDEVYAACRDAFARKEPLLDALLRRPAIASALPRDQLAALCEPSNYLGTAGAMVDRVLARHIKR